MKINWFSPLPPARTDIGHYTARIVSALSRRAEITLWACQDDWDSSLEQYATIRRWSGDAWTDLNRADLTFYHIGNNRLFHQAIWETSRRHPGVVVLHDLRLQHLFLGIYLDIQGQRDAYERVMTDYYGHAGRRAARQFFAGELNAEALAERWPLTEHALEGACAVLVHTHDALETLAASNRWPVGCLPLPYPSSLTPPLPRPCDPSAPRRLIVFGYLGANRQLDKLLQALAGLPERLRLQLDIYGQLDQPDRVRAQIRALGLGGIVNLHGFVSESELDRALDHADLAVNLRYPSMGEASGSQLRIWDHALPSLVTRTGWYATLPETTVAFVRPEHEVADIQQHLRQLLIDPEHFASLGCNGRRRLQAQHAPDQYAEALCRFIPVAQNHRRIGLLDPLIARLRHESVAFPQPFRPNDWRRLAGELNTLVGMPAPPP
ncbi:MAG: glycosyltransferase family 4 protein [Candidatus Competibacter sp.]|nr:glycosyltransferase family 4 protein [Candidatus Competibacter sp.]MDG4606013.1 glycosyltransferase family 4 protein [Candidatus Contendobacter sp.]HRD49603.1 glycosyltransferase family 4 protein [Candidatus Contendobacter sp.]